jgi:hypothetical protein
MSGCNRARERRLARRHSRKLFKSGNALPPEVYLAYLEGMVRGTRLRDQEDGGPADDGLLNGIGSPPAATSSESEDQDVLQHRHKAMLLH